MRRTMGVFLCCFLGWVAVAGAERAPQDSYTEAITKINVAQEVFGEAQALIMTDPTADKVRAAITLYAQAGQLFEQALTIFRGLGPQYVAQSDLDNCARAMAQCVEAIRQCSEHLNR